MKIFLTGATGYIGSALARRFLKEGHSVSGLVRSREKAARLAAEGLRPVLGDIKEPRSYERVARESDALVHAGFEYGPDARRCDEIAVETLIGCVGQGRGPGALIYTSGVWVLGPARGAPSTESDPLQAPAIVAWRPSHENRVLAVSGRGVSAAVVRPGCVYGDCGGLYGKMLHSLFDDRVIRLVGDGGNRWASVYLDDLAELYLLILQKRPEMEIYHATDGSADKIEKVAAAFLEAAGGGSIEKTPERAARRELGPLAEALAMDQWVSSAKAREHLGWKPRMSSAARNAVELLSEWHDKALGGVVS